MGKPKTSHGLKPKMTPKGKEPAILPKKVIPKKICIKCKQETGPGIPHPCTANATKKNLAELILKESTSGQEQILGKGLKALVYEKMGDPGEEIRLTGL